LVTEISTYFVFSTYLISCGEIGDGMLDLEEAFTSSYYFWFSGLFIGVADV